MFQRCLTRGHRVELQRAPYTIFRAGPQAGIPGGFIAVCGIRQMGRVALIKNRCIFEIK